MSVHGYDKKRFPLTVAQGRVLYHTERLFRSTGAGMREHSAFVARMRAVGLDIGHVESWSLGECLYALDEMESAARSMAKFRSIDTGRADFLPGGRFACAV